MTEQDSAEAAALLLLAAALAGDRSRLYAVVGFYGAGGNPSGGTVAPAVPSVTAS